MKKLLVALVSVATLGAASVSMAATTGCQYYNFYYESAGGSSPAFGVRSTSHQFPYFMIKKNSNPSVNLPITSKINQSNPLKKFYVAQFKKVNGGYQFVNECTYHASGSVYQGSNCLRLNVQNYGNVCKIGLPGL